MSHILEQAEQFVSDLLAEKLPRDLCYHSPAHTFEVVANTKEIGMNSNLTEDELEIVILAAWFHDTGFTRTYDGHEEVSSEIAEKFLSMNKYPPERIKIIVECINKTHLGKIPTNKYEVIICDADLLYLGKSNFFDRYQSLREEWRKIFGKIYNEKEWLQINHEFFLQHHFYTEYANRIYSSQKKVNLEKLKKKLQENNFLDNNYV